MDGGCRRAPWICSVTRESPDRQPTSWWGLAECDTGDLTDVDVVVAERRSIEWVDAVDGVEPNERSGVYGEIAGVALVVAEDGIFSLAD